MHPCIAPSINALVFSPCRAFHEKFRGYRFFSPIAQFHCRDSKCSGSLWLAALSLIGPGHHTPVLRKSDVADSHRQHNCLVALPERNWFTFWNLILKSVFKFIIKITNFNINSEISFKWNVLRYILKFISISMNI